MSNSTCSVAAPLHVLTSSNRQLSSSPQAEAATVKEELALRSTSSVPAQTNQFIEEVDASDSDNGEVLSQQSDKDNRTHSCAYFSRKLYQTERNSSVGDNSFLLSKTALEEWKNWLEGVEQPFLGWTDMNLEYTRREARWALFFSRFNFTLCYSLAQKMSRPASCLAFIPQSQIPSLRPSFCLLPVSWEL